jgi:hypothetical protein
MPSHSNYTQVSVTSGTPYKLQLGAPYRGELNRIVVKQTSGTLAGFTVDVYDCDPDSPPNTDDKDVHKILGTITVAGSASTAAEYDKRYAYANKEIDSTDLSLRPKSRITIVINASGTLAKPFHVGITTSNDV